MKKSTLKLIVTIFLSLSLVALTACGSNVNDGASNLVKNANLMDSNYKPGDYMGDYTVTDINGNDYTFSELLEDKKAIVLNFWFVGCGPCQMEFPYLQAAANEYSDDIAVLAINPTDDRETHIQNYAVQNDLSIPLIKGDIAWNYALNLDAFPTTIVIDRYGRIAFSHTGAVFEAGVFEKIFAHFSADDYEHKVVNKIEDIN